jgi:hypothetical protein
MSTRVHVVVRHQAPPETIEAVNDLFREARVNADVERNPALGGADVVQVVVDSLPWLALAFAGGAAGKAGADSWDAFRDGGWRGLASFIRGVGHATECVGLEFQPSASAKVSVQMPIPDEVLRQLGDLDWSRLKTGELRWHPADDQWSLYESVDAEQSGLDVPEELRGSRVLLPRPLPIRSPHDSD